MKNLKLQDNSSLKTVQFLLRHYKHLFTNNKYNGLRQLNGVYELVEFSNAFVLSDTVIISGLEPHKKTYDEISASILCENELKTTIQIAGEGSRYDYNVESFYEPIGLKNIINEINKISDDDYEKESIHYELSKRARILQQQAHILLADSIQGSYIPEREYGFAALENYTNLFIKSKHPLIEEFIKRSREEFSSFHQLPKMDIQIPCFFAEALRQSQTPKGILSTLIDLKWSKAASVYRDRMKIIADDSEKPKIRTEAAVDMQKELNIFYKKENFESRIPRSIIYISTLLPFIIAAFFPSKGLFGTILPAAILAIDDLDQYFRRRSSIFELYSNIIEIDLFDELERVFPNISFGPNQLTYFLNNEQVLGLPENLSILKGKL